MKFYPSLFVVPLLLSQHLSAFVFSGTLSSSDLLATDSTAKTFYYDAFALTNTTSSPITIADFTLDVGPNMKPWMNLWDTAVLPTLDWESPVSIYDLAIQTSSSSTAGEAVSFSSFTLPAFAEYQIAIATSDYLEDGALLDTYEISFSASGVVLTQVPEPAILATLLGLLCVGLNLSRRKNR